MNKTIVDKDIKEIWYEGELRKVCEVDYDHLHLDDGTVIRHSEIKNTPRGYESTFSMTQEVNDLRNKFKKTLSLIEKYLKI